MSDISCGYWPLDESVGDSVIPSNSAKPSLALVSNVQDDGRNAGRKPNGIAQRSRLVAKIVNCRALNRHDKQSYHWHFETDAMIAATIQVHEDH